jgi:hypothetical protein
MLPLLLKTFNVAFAYYFSLFKREMPEGQRDFYFNLK